MANQTVYPYGTGGQLPSSIGIINDLVTGGTDKALSAEMGKTLQQEIDESGYVSIDRSQGYWTKAQADTYCKFLPDGDTFVIQKVASVNLNRVGYTLNHLEDGKTYRLSFNISTPAGSSIWLYRMQTLTGSPNRVYLNVEIPAESNNLAVSVDITKTSVVELVGFTVESAFADGADITITNWHITEQVATGVYAEEDAGEGILYGLTKHSYAGERIHPANSVAIQELMPLTNKTSIQAACSYGNYAFVQIKSGHYIDVYDIKGKGFIGRFEKNPWASDGKYHCNTAFFSDQFYDAQDEFPVLFVSTGYPVNGAALCLGFRVQKTVSGGIVSFTFTLVQTISLAFTDIVWGEVTGAGPYLYIRVNSDKDRWVKVAAPSVTAGDVTLTDADIISSAVFQDYLHAAGYDTQGYYYHNGRIFSVWGTTAPYYFGAIDPERGVIVTAISLTDMGIDKEVEAPFVFDGHICFNTTHSFHRLYFD